jgi:error-prone DNA polymerase
MPESPAAKAQPHPFRVHTGAGARSAQTPRAAYAELSTTSNYSFLTGASHPEELVERAAELGMPAIALTDENSLGGMVRAHLAAKRTGVSLVVGCRLVLTDQDPLQLLVYPTDRAAYGRLCRLLTLGKRRAEKGECRLALADVIEHEEGLLAVAIPPGVLDDRFAETLRVLRGVFDADRLSLAASRHYGPDDDERLRRVALLGGECRVPPVALNDAVYHAPERRPLQDVLTCVRLGTTIDAAGRALTPNAERHLKSAEEMARLFASMPAAPARSVEVAERCRGFSLAQLRYEYPDEVCPPGITPMHHLIGLTWKGAGGRYPSGVPEKVRRQVEHEFALIEELGYAPYFLTVQEVVTFARSRGILCQGRGAAANSAVCYCLGVTAVDPGRLDLLFERFISRERDEPPDIDIDFEHERREEVIQHLYEKYGRERAALTAEVITYRGRSAVRDVGKAMGLSLDAVDHLAKSLDWWDGGAVKPDRLRELGMNPDDPILQRTLSLCAEVLGFPRHRSQHVGGFVLSRGPLCELVPIENAAMPERTVIEWDKDDIDALGLLKVDVLGLGMLTCLRKAFELVNGDKVSREKVSRCRGVEVPREDVTARTASCLSLDTSTPRHLDTFPLDTFPLDNSYRGLFQDSGEHTHGNDQVVSGSRGLAEGQGTEQGGLSGNGAHAQVRDVRLDVADAAGLGLHPVEHRGGIQPQDKAGVSAGPADRQRVTGRVEHAMGDCGRTGDAPAESGDRRSARRGRPDALCIDPEVGGQQVVDACGNGSHAGQEVSRCQGVEVPREDVTARTASCLSLDTSTPRHLDTFSLDTSTPRHLDTFSLDTSTPRHLDTFLSLSTLPLEDPAVYDMLCQADSVGVFQVESRAQMSMLPRLRPRCYYDLVIEVAIVRPGPIQGKMVHPYLRRRAGEEPVTYPNDDVRRVLGRTLGVPLFQEQAMSLAIVAGGFTPGEADELRRAIASWKRKGDAIFRLGEKLVAGMLARGYDADFAARCFEQIKGFSEYGFPESHAASFAHLVYASSWLKRHHPAAFAAALINSQPMGFYAPAQIVRDAKEHGVEVRPIDVNASAWDCVLEEATERRDDEGEAEAWRRWGLGGPSIRLGVRLVKGMRQAHADAIAAARLARGHFTSIADLWRRSGVPVAQVERWINSFTFGRA